MAMRRIFWGFCRNWFLIDPLQYLSSRFRFRLRIRGDIHIRKMTPPLSPIQWVAYSAYQWYGEPPTPRITDTRSRQLPASLIRGAATSCITDMDDSLYRWVGESPTPCITNMESRRLRVSLSRGVDDSVDRWYRESSFKEKLIWCRFSELLMAKPCL